MRGYTSHFVISCVIGTSVSRGSYAGVVVLNIVVMLPQAGWAMTPF